MRVRGSQLNDGSSRTVLIVAKSGCRDGLFSSKLESIWSFPKPAYDSKFKRNLPPFCSTGPLLEQLQPNALLEPNKIACTVMTPGENNESGGLFCAMLLVAIIGHRAEYLSPNKDVNHCEKRFGARLFL